MEKGFLDKVEDNAAVQTWSEWNDKVKQLFYPGYGDLPYLLDIKVDKHLFCALAQFWNPVYSCFTFWELIWCLQWMNTLPYFVARRFK
ncbi:hypothetical protein Gotur_007728 [Gossypium turneri]